MSLAGWQQAMGELVGSPERCERLRDGDLSLLDRYELTDRERRRVVAAVAEPGMLVNCTLYRVNRLGPLLRTLPLTCEALGDDLRTEAWNYWEVTPYSTLQFRTEAIRFAAYLRGRLAAGALHRPLVEDTLAVDLAMLDLRLDDAASTSTAGSRVRVVCLRHHPDVVFGVRPLALAQEPTGQHWLLVDGTGPEIDLHVVDRATAASFAADTLPPAVTRTPAEPVPGSAHIVL